MTVLLFANGDLEEGSWVQDHLKTAAKVVAADGGSRHLWRLGHLPDVVIGDLDSLPQNVERWLKKHNVNLIQYPQEKDETDLELALLYVVARSQDLVKVFAAAGGRLDQTLANIQLLAHPGLINRQIELVTPHERAWLITSETEILGEVGDSVSLIPLDGNAHIGQTSGLQWPLIDETLHLGPARGISNKMTARLATVTVSSGKVLCVHMRQIWQR